MFLPESRQAGELSKQGLQVKLQEQPFQILAAMIERPCEVVTREDLQKLLWPADTNGDVERGLNRAVNRLREALGDAAENPRFIQTLPPRGYRFRADVLPTPADAPSPLPASSSPLRRRGWLALAGGLIGGPLAAVGRRFLRPLPPRIESIAVLPLETLSSNPEQG